MLEIMERELRVLVSEHLMTFVVLMCAAIDTSGCRRRSVEVLRDAQR